MPRVEDRLGSGRPGRADEAEVGCRCGDADGLAVVAGAAAELIEAARLFVGEGGSDVADCGPDFGVSFLGEGGLTEYRES